MSKIKSILNVASLTFFSRILGLVRELVFAKYFGTTQIADVINLSFRLPNLLRKIFAEGAMSSIFIPEFNSRMLISLDRAKKFSEKILVLISILSIIFVILIEIFMPQLLYLIAPGFSTDDAKFHIAITMCRITIPYIFFISIISLFGSILNSIGIFKPFAFTSVIMNICLILGMIFLNNYFSYYSFAISLLIAGILQLIVIMRSLAQSGVQLDYIGSLNYLKYSKIKKSLNNKNSDFYRIFKNSNFALIISGLQQLNIFISQSFASFIDSAISLINYADRINQICISIIGVTLSTVLLPELSYLYKKQEFIKIHSLQNSFLRWGSFVSIPTSIFVLIFAEQIVAILFQRGNFTIQDTKDTALVLSIMIVSSIPIILAKILNNIFYAMQQLQNLITISLYMIISNIILTYPLLKLLGLIGIICSNAIISWINLMLLMYIAIKKSYFMFSTQTWRFFLKTLMMNLIFLIMNLYSKNYIISKFNADSIINILYFGIIILGEFILYVSLAYGFRIFDELMFHNKNEK